VSVAQADRTREIVWRGMTRDELDAAYNNSAAVANSAAKLAEWTERSAALRRRHPHLLDLPYGPRPRNRIDIFRCGRDSAPLFVFIHGGYWQRNSKDMFGCMAEGPMARGFDAALVGYTLAPDATLREIVGEIRAAIGWLRRQGFGGSRLIVSGWSAGGHLTATVMDMDEVDGGLAISGIFDVEPCRLNYLNARLQLSAEEAAAMSPALHLPQRSAPLAIACGTRELPELQRQSKEYADIRGSAGLATTFQRLEGHDHYSILEELASPDGRLTAILGEL
jgi:arylformamidase